MDKFQVAQLGLFICVVLLSSTCLSAPVTDPENSTTEATTTVEAIITSAEDSSEELPDIEDWYRFTSFILYYLGEDNSTIQNKSFSVYEADKLMNDPNFKQNQTTIMFVHGYHNTVNTKLVQELVRSIVLHRDDRNCIVVDWDYFALLNYQSQSSRLAKNYGMWVGEVIYNTTMRTQGTFYPKYLHLVGASLGAHVCGGMGQGIYQNSGIKAGRITGLDPAGPNFEGGVPNANNSLTKDDAEFCDMWHTDMGYYGINHSLGHADFFPNDGKRAQPGCPETYAEVTADETNTCSHEAPVKYFAASCRIKHSSKDFWATKKHENGTYDESDQHPMSINCISSARGNYYLKTGPIEPYSLGESGAENLSYSD